MKRAAILIAAVLLVVACGRYGLVEPERQEIGGLYTVDPQIAWSKRRDGGVELWTVNGPDLEAVRFFKGLEDKDVLLKEGDRDKLPRFRKDMTASEVMEFVVDSLIVAGVNRVEATDLRPAPFGKLDGFRFELAFVTDAGLEYEGLVVGTVVDEALHLIMYTGAREHYYAKYKDEVERLIASIEM